MVQALFMTLSGLFRYSGKVTYYVGAVWDRFELSKWETLLSGTTSSGTHCTYMYVCNDSDSVDTS